MKSKTAKTLLTFIPAALGAAAVAAMYVSYWRDLRAAKARVSSGNRMIETPGGPIEYADTLPVLPQGMQQAARLAIPDCPPILSAKNAERMGTEKAAQPGSPGFGGPGDRTPSRATSAHADISDWQPSPSAKDMERAGKIGTRPGAPVLVIHGAGGGFDQGLELGRPLIESGYRVIAPSRFGYLGTPLPEDASPMAQADAHARLLDALGIDKTAVVAFSAGAPSAMQLCLRHPGRCRALVLAVPLAYCPRAESAAGEEGLEETSAVKEFLLNTMLGSDFTFWALGKVARTAMIRTILGTPPEDLRQAGPEEEARLMEFLAHIEPVSRRKKGLANETAIGRSLRRYELERLETPTLVIGVENCLYNTYPAARYTAEHVPGARLVSYRDGGHLVVGHSEEMWREILEFLATTAETARQEKKIS